MTRAHLAFLRRFRLRARDHPHPGLAEAGALGGALVTIDAIACNPTIAADITEAGADYVLAVKDNQPSLRAEIASFFDTAPAAALDTLTDVDKDHGRIETRRVSVSHQVD